MNELMVKINGRYRPAPAQLVLDAAAEYTRQTVNRDRPCLTSPEVAAQYLVPILGHREHEIFGIVFLNAQHQVIEFSELFRGTIDCTSVYVREVVKEALARNAAAVILVHNHPSGCDRPSGADLALTDELSKALKIMGIRVLDHFLVVRDKLVSFGQLGVM